MNVDILLEIAKWLSRDNDFAHIARLKEMEKNQSFYVTVWGHYSAGKSKLINNIFNRDILPVKSRETTAVLTYIQYGENEGCTIVYKNGITESYEVDVLKRIFQNTSEFEKVGEIDHIEVYVNDDLLKTGLILVDTPGVNTIIQKHQDLAIDSIEQSGRILYVLGNAPSNVDRQFIKQIASCGIRISFIRTKCDRFIEAEEDVDSSLKKEEDEVNSFVESQTEYIPVSNEKGNRWFANIDKVRELLGDISVNISDEMERVREERIGIFGEKYLKELQVEEKRLIDIDNGNIQSVSEDIKKCESELKILDDIMADIENKMEDKIKKVKLISQGELNNLITHQIDRFANALSSVQPDQNVTNEVKKIYSYSVTETIEKIQKLLNFYFDDIVKEETESILACIHDDFTNIPIPTYSEVQQENSRYLEMYKSRLIQTKQKIENIVAERQKNSEALSELMEEYDEDAYTAALELYDKKLAEIPSEIPLRLSEHQNIQPSAIFKAIGMAADVALLLLPGDVIFSGVKSVANTTKIAQTFHKMGKVGEVIIKAGETVGKNAKSIDRVRDITYAVNEVLGKRRYSTKAEKEAAEKLVNTMARQAGDALDSWKTDKKTGNVLDALSVAYWTEKFGKRFDSAPRMEIDIEEQKYRNQLRKEITQEQQKMSEERMKNRRELKLLQDKENEMKIRIQEEEIQKQRIEEEMSKQESIVLEKAHKVALNKYREDYKRYYEAVIKQIAKDISEQYFRTASQNLVMYVSSQNAELMESIKIKKEQMSKLLELKKDGNSEIKTRLVKCRELLNKLEESE